MIIEMFSLFFQETGANSLTCREYKPEDSAAFQFKLKRRA